jgi:hypothetical protein
VKIILKPTKQQQKKSYPIGEVFRDKKIKPWFWVFTLVYFLGAGYLILSSNPWHSDGRNHLSIAYILIIPYYILSTIYIIFVHRNDKEK